MTEANASSESVKALHDFVKSSRRRRGNGRKSKKSDKNKSDTDTKSQKKVEDGMNNVQVSAMQIKPPSSKTVTKTWITKSASQIDSMTSWRM
ncbi:hypothetical protein FRC02_002788 [Tulasnella sp. 418]|nr:hypothetical protein FRC02_002788 [Tulasnella sp. 418]